MSIQNEFRCFWDGWLKKCILPVNPAHQNDSVDRVIQLMLNQQLGVLPLIDDHGVFCGVVKSCDLMRWSIVPINSFITNVNKIPDLCGATDHFFRYAHDLYAKEVMVQDDNIVVNPQMNTSQIFFIFSKISSDELFVIDSESKIQGIISRTNFLRIYNQFADTHKKNQQIKQTGSINNKLTKVDM